MLDLVDIMRSNTVVTLPSLLGLAPAFDAKGADVLTVYHEMRALAEVSDVVVLWRLVAHARPDQSVGRRNDVARRGAGQRQHVARIFLQRGREFRSSDDPRSAQRAGSAFSGVVFLFV